MAKLKAKEPQACTKRLKLFMFGDAGVGKTTSSCMLPSPYIIDGERGTDNYAELITKAGGAVLQTTDMDEVINEVRLLRTEKHPYKTLVIDPITPLYYDLVEKCELRVGSEWGRHYGEANKVMRRLVNLLMDLDMNVVMTAHSKAVYGDEMKKAGITFDGWKRLDYIFDLVLELRKKTPTKRYASVVKTRINSFPDGDTFEWSYEAIADRYDLKEIERKATVVEIASPEQVEKIISLAKGIKEGDELVAKWLKKGNVELITDLTKEQASKIITALKKKIGALNV